MAKVINISDKLEFESNPIMQIGTLEVEVNADAETVLRLMGVLSGKGELEAVNEAMSLIFNQEDVKAICALKKGGKKLSARSLMTIIQEAMNLVLGEDEQGEQ